MKLKNMDEQFAIYGMLFSLSNRIQTIGDKEFADITMKQHFLMIVLGMLHEPPTLKEMGDIIGCSYQNVKRMSIQLEKNQYLEIVADAKDKRKLRLRPTGKFEKIAEESKVETMIFMQNLYGKINHHDLEITLRTLKRMDQNLGGQIE